MFKVLLACLVVLSLVHAASAQYVTATPGQITVPGWHNGAYGTWTVYGTYYSYPQYYSNSVYYGGYYATPYYYTSPVNVYQYPAGNYRIQVPLIYGR